MRTIPREREELKEPQEGSVDLHVTWLFTAIATALQPVCQALCHELKRRKCVPACLS